MKKIIINLLLTLVGLCLGFGIGQKYQRILDERWCSKPFGKIGTVEYKTTTSCNWLECLEEK